MSDVKEEKKVEVKSEETSEHVEETKEEGKKEQDLAVREERQPLSVFRRMDSLFNEMTRWFDDMFWRPRRLFDIKSFDFDEDRFFRTPLANVSEDDHAFHMTAELPGLDKGDLEVTIHDGQLEIKGEKKAEHEEKKEGYVRREYSSSSYFRSFELPENVDENKIDATLEKGILKLDLPKKEIEEKEKKKIAVK